MADRAPLYRGEFVLGILAFGRMLWMVSWVVIGLYSWKLLLALYMAAFLLSRLILDGLVERFVLVPVVRLLMRVFGVPKE